MLCSYKEEGCGGTGMYGDFLAFTNPCGFFGGRCHAVEDGRLLQSLAQHKDLVTCIAASSDGRTVVSGIVHPPIRHPHL